MTASRASYDIGSDPELARLVHEIRSTQEPRVLTEGGEDVAVILPLERARRRSLPLPRLPKGSVVAMTAGMLANDIPALTAEQEREAFELAVSEEVAEETGG